MIKRFSLLACVAVFCSGQICQVRVNPVTGSPLSDADADFIISRNAEDSTARVEADITRGFAGVRLEDGQTIEVNGEDLVGDRRDFDATVDASDVYMIEVTDPRRGTDVTDVPEPQAFEITSPGEGGDASLSGFTIEWQGADEDLDVEVDISQRLLGDNLSLSLGPATDEGRLEISSRRIADAGFGQGEDLTITVTKIRRTNDIRGFADGRAETRLSVSIDATPQP
ncbi:MAG TPA: hypothetical protein VNT79_12645 [Phycisphaerae bacterium]|nr:hypothetical protein [Phycisphaerae bacterium]